MEATPNEPRKLALRRSEVLAWTGISADEFRSLIANGIVHGTKLKPNGRLYFYREHIRAAILNPLQAPK
jgi:hypothetical protein